MEQLKIGDLVRREGNHTCEEVEGIIKCLYANGMVRAIELTKDYCEGILKIGQEKMCLNSHSYQKFYLVSKHPPIKTKFLGGYIE